MSTAIENWVALIAVTGDSVYLQSIGGMVELNNQAFTVTYEPLAGTACVTTAGFVLDILVMALLVNAGLFDVYQMEFLSGSYAKWNTPFASVWVKLNRY